MSYIDGPAPAVAVAASHPQPLLSAELVGPDGASLGAGIIEPAAPATLPGGSPVGVGVGVFGGSGGGFGTGIGLGFPLGGAPAPPPASATRYRARIAIANPDAYRRDWERTIVRLRFGQSGDTATAEIPAPPPRQR